MKKVILVVAMIFATSSFVNANTESEGPKGSCGAEAWNYGTKHGGGSSYWSYHLTDWYYNKYC